MYTCIYIHIYICRYIHVCTYLDTHTSTSRYTYYHNMQAYTNRTKATFISTQCVLFRHIQH